jgi:hypothetical protein
MVMSGRKPSERPTVTRHKPTVDWTEVANTPFTGQRPVLPEVREIMNKAGDVSVYPMPVQTVTWWESVTTMPHCVLWSPSDWAFCLDTALIHAQAVTGVVSAMSELRQREKILGTTLDARRDLRIRYVNAETEPVTLAPVDDLDERRARLVNA